MKYMDSVPDSAICNEAVKLAGKRGFVNLKGFVNGVLRNISRNLDKINYPDEKDKVSYLSVKYSLPEWLVKQWLNVYDEGTVKTIGSAFLEENPLTVRFNEHKIKKEEKSKEDWQMKGYDTSNGYMGYVEGKYILFASEQEYFEFMED